MASYNEHDESCLTCGVEFCIPIALYESLRKTHALYYCPNGHSQHYTGKTDEQKRIEKLEAELVQQRRDEHRRFGELMGRLGKLEQIVCMCPLCGDKTGQRNWRDETNAAKLQEHLRDEHGARQRLRALMPGISETG